MKIESTLWKKHSGESGWWLPLWPNNTKQTNDDEQDWAQQLTQEPRVPRSSLATSSTMTHILPAHGEPNIGPHTSISSALEMDQTQASNSASPTSPSVHPHDSDQAASASNGRKRKKQNGENDESPSMSEPRRLRRSHEACARCRSKKIKASPVGRHRLLFGNFPKCE